MEDVWTLLQYVPAPHHLSYLCILGMLRRESAAENKWGKKRHWTLPTARLHDTEATAAPISVPRSFELPSHTTLSNDSKYGGHAADIPALASRCKEEGLTNAEAERRRGIFGPNKLESKETSAILQFLS